MPKHFNPKPPKPVSEVASGGEIRVRNPSKEVLKALPDVAAKLRSKTVPDTVERLILRYSGDQELLRQLQHRNNDLHQKIAKYMDREAEMRQLVELFITQTGKFNAMVVAGAKQVLRKFVGTKKISAAKPRRVASAKRVPSKKAAAKKSKPKQGRLL
jgi:hypothetical protein